MLLLQCLFSLQNFQSQKCATSAYEKKPICFYQANIEMFFMVNDANKFFKKPKNSFFGVLPSAIADVLPEKNTAQWPLVIVIINFERNKGFCSICLISI